MATTPISQLRATTRLEAASRDDATQLSRAQAGDPDALDWLVRGHWQRTRRLLVRVFGPRQDLDDLVQTTFLETLRALPHFRHESSLSTFITAIAVRVGRRARRPHKVLQLSQPLTAAGELLSGDASAELRLSQKETLRRVQTALAKLSDPKRVAFMLWAVEGLPIEEVAQAMQASVSATRSRVFYAQRELKAAAQRDPYLREWIGGGRP